MPASSPATITLPVDAQTAAAIDDSMRKRIAGCVLERLAQPANSVDALSGWIDNLMAYEEIRYKPITGLDDADLAILQELLGPDFESSTQCSLESATLDHIMRAFIKLLEGTKLTADAETSAVENWLFSYAVVFGQRPIDTLKTNAGRRELILHIGRLMYGTYT